ncbi:MULTISPECIES: DEAD/DEAH box helicase [unclassified Paenibacillus]|uniref:SNF2-related protein n=1 Tax=Paenibacillus provencensis TaxID=441151 RepID=A0ABW3QH51_9BACL|nr:MULTISPECIES: DEAD/DEAH box helicase [unclassified Paenibacillus]MCM3130188.1 DEAD/DEAH box helicase [Paenibacillus sp. MER 78]SDX71339.1 Helicase conserved C-terminal domain-containing protein [Paenibacillus sp. PDC88]SFS88663.1 Helicase conserved C-terminal domain-containing protein [Paenibacillus sp. 453mf]
MISIMWGIFMAKIEYTRQGLEFKSSSLQEAMNLSECLIGESVNKEIFTWHSLVTRSDGPINEMHPVTTMDSWDIQLDDKTIKDVQNVLDSKRRAYRRSSRSLDEWRDTPEFKTARERVVELFGKPFKDGSVLFPYQIDIAAYIVSVKTLMNACDMGMGKTRTTIVGLASDSTNQLNLIITMKRNINDWQRELELLNFVEGTDYIVLNSPRDLKKTKGVRFHLVSYEKWSNERVVFRKKVHHECPHCEAGPGNFNANFQYCMKCNRKAASIIDPETNSIARWSQKDLPKLCPDCGSEWKKGNTTCNQERLFKHNGVEEIVKCNYTVIEKKIPSLSHYFHKGYDSVTVDEAHYISNIDTKRARSVLRTKAKTRVLLTGTPAENEVTDLYWLLGWLTGFSSRFEDPLEAASGRPKPFAGYGKVGAEHFRAYYGGGAKRRVLDVDSVEARVGHHEQLWKILDTVMVRKKKTDEDVKDYIAVPEPKHIRYHLDLMPAERELYDSMVEEFRLWYEEELEKKSKAEIRGETYRISTIKICTWMDKLRKASSCPWVFPNYNVLNGRTTAKLQYIENKVKDYVRRGKKVLLFSGHKETIEHLKLTLDEIIPGRYAEYIHGEVAMEHRWDVMKKFQDSSDPLSILVMSHRTGAESYTLTEAKAVFIVDLDFNGKKIEQCYSRAVRLGQKDEVEVHWLLGTNTIDVNIHGVVLSKISGVNLAVDRQGLDMSDLAHEFEGDSKTASQAVDMEKFAKDMLKGGTKRKEITSAAV